MEPTYEQLEIFMENGNNMETYTSVSEREGHIKRKDGSDNLTLTVHSEGQRSKRNSE